MARREDFSNALWSDPDFLALSPGARLTYIWTWTNPRCGMAGIYKLSPIQATLELGMSEEEITEALAELGKARFAFYEDNVLWVRSRVKHLRQKTQQIATSIRNDLRAVPDEHPLKGQFIKTYENLSWLSSAVSGEPLDPSKDPANTGEPHARLYGGGTGGGTGGVRKGWSRARASQAPTKPYEPNPEDIALRDAHFPDQPVEAVASCAATLRFRRQDVTPEALRPLLYGEAA